jgi:hypothetical protein
VPVLHKQAGAWCTHIIAQGCAIHGPGMPEICRQYDCVWREDDTLPDAWRPDRIGIVVTSAGNVTVGCDSLPVVLFHLDLPEEPPCPADNQGVPSEPGGLDVSFPPDSLEAMFSTNPSDAQGMLAHFVSRGAAVMIIRGLEARVEFDRGRWPEFLPEDIEEELRYELSQDAEELKRLGAVGDDYRALSREEAAAACRAERASKQK